MARAWGCSGKEASQGRRLTLRGSVQSSDFTNIAKEATQKIVTRKYFFVFKINFSESGPR